MDVDEEPPEYNVTRFVVNDDVVKDKMREEVTVSDDSKEEEELED